MPVAAMKTALFAVAAFLAAPALSSGVSQAEDKAAIVRLGSVWQESWNRRDAAGLASIMDDDVTFVSVLGPATPGYGQKGSKTGFEASHAQLFKTMFADSRWATESVRVVRFLQPDLAIAQVVWTTTGDKVRHVKHRTPRRGAFLWVVQKQPVGWRVLASQNTEALPPLPGQ